MQIEKIDKFIPSRKVIITLLMIIGFLVNPNAVSIQPPIIPEHQYFIDQTFGVGQNMDMWEGEFEDFYSHSTVLSSRATMRFSLSSWNVHDPLFFSFKGLGVVTFYSIQGIKLFRSGPTGNELVDLSEYFVGYRSSPYSHALSGESYNMPLLIIELFNGGEYESIQLFSDVIYSLTSDNSFKMNLALTSSSQMLTILGDKPIDVYGVRTFASQFTTNARSFKVFDISEQMAFNLDGEKPVDIAADFLVVPTAPVVTMSYGVALSSIEPIKGGIDVAYRFHLLTPTQLQISDDTAITGWASLNAYETIYFSDPLDIRALSGIKGRITIEIDTYIDELAPEYRPETDVHFVLLQFDINTNVLDTPSQIAEEIYFADYAYASESEITYNTEGAYLRSSTSGEFATYMLDTMQIAISNDLEDGDFYSDFTFIGSPNHLSYELEAGILKQNYSTNYPIDTSDIADQALYTGLNDDPNFWNRESYGYVIDTLPDYNLGMTVMGMSIGSPTNYFEVLLHIDPHEETFNPRIEIYQYNIPTSSRILKESLDIDPLEFSIDANLPTSMIVMDNDGYLELYIVQDKQLSYVGAYPAMFSAGYRTSFGLIGHIGSIDNFEISVVEDDLMNKIYIKAANPSDVPITISAKLTTPLLLNEIELGSILVPANTKLDIYPLKVNPGSKFSTVDRIVFSKNAPGKEIILDSFVIEGLSQPGFERVAARYYDKNPDVYTVDDAIRQDDRVFSSDRYYDSFGSDPGFEGIDPQYQFTISNPSYGTLIQMITTDQFKVYRGIASLRMQAIPQGTDTVYEIRKSIDFSIRPDAISFSYLATNFQFDSDESDMLEVYLYHPTAAAGANRISALGMYSMREMTDNIEDVSGINLIEDIGLITVEDIGALVQNSWVTVNVPIDSGLIADDQWELVIRIHTKSGIDRPNVNPTIYIDELKAYEAADPPFIFSIDAFMRGGVNRLEIEGLVTGKSTDSGYMYATYRIGIRALDSTITDYSDVEFIGTSIRMSGNLQTLTEKGITFELPRSGKYEILIFWDDRLPDQTGIVYEITKISNPDPSTSAGAWDYDSERTSVDGFTADFDMGAGNSLYSSGSFSESISFKKSVFSQIYDGIIGGFTLDRVWAFNVYDPVYTATIDNTLVEIANGEYVERIDRHYDLSNWGFGVTDAAYVTENPDGVPLSSAVDYLDNLKAYYTFDSHLLDTSGNGYDAIAVGGASYAPEVVNDGFQFTGSNYLSSSSSIFGTTAGTVSFWLRASSWDAQIIYVKGNVILNLDSSGNLDLKMNRDSFDTGFDITAGYLNHIVITWNSGTAYAYLNKTKSAAMSYGTMKVGTPYIGATDRGRDLLASGSMVDDFRAYTLEITQTEVDSIFNYVEEQYMGPPPVVDNTAPDLSSPIDISYEEGAQGNSITWIAGDANPNNVNVTRDGSLVLGNTSWTNGSIVVDVDSLSVGVYVFVITVDDLEGNYAQDTVLVTVSGADSDPPVISTPADVNFNEGDTGYSISWTLNDANPSFYNISKDGSPFVADTSYTDGQTIVVDLDGTPFGTYIFTIAAIDLESNISFDTVSVNVLDVSSPTTSSPNDLIYDLGSTGNEIAWLPSDLNPDSYSLYIEESLDSSNSWTDSSPVTINVDGLSLGSYNYTIVFFDDAGLSVSDTVIVYVVDTSNPTIDSPIDVQYEEGTSGHSLTWTVNDADSSTWNVTLNAGLYDSGIWTSGNPINVDIDGLGIGVHIFEIRAYDGSGNYISDIIEVTVVDTSLDSLTDSGDSAYEEGDTGNSVSWTATDAHTDSYEIYRNGELVDSGIWTSGTAITYNTDGLSMGAYNFSIIVYDTSNNFLTDSLYLTITDTVIPVLQGTIDPSHLVTEGVEYNFTITVSDNNADFYVAYLNGTEIQSGTFTSGLPIIIIIHDGTLMGLYDLQIIFYDASSNELILDTIIDIRDLIAPMVDHPIDRTIYGQVIGNVIIWNPTDLHAGTYNVSINSMEHIAETAWTSGQPIIVNIDGLAGGIYDFSLYLKDGSGNVYIDTVRIYYENGKTVATQNEVTYEVNNGTLYTYGAISDLDQWLTNSIKYLLPSMNETNWNVSITDIAWQSNPGDKFYAYVSIYAFDTRLARLGIVSPWADYVAFEKIQTLYGSWEMEGSYTALTASGRNLTISGMNGYTNITAYINDEWHTFGNYSNYMPTHIQIDYIYRSDETTIRTSFADSTHFAIGELRYSSYEGMENSVISTDYGLQLETVIGGSYQITPVDSTLEVSDYPIFEMYITPGLMIGGIWGLAFVYNNTKYLVSLRAGMNRFNVQEIINSTSGTIDEIWIEAPYAGRSRINIESIRMFGIYDTTITFDETAYIDSVVYVKGSGIVVEGNGVDISIALNSTNFDILNYQFFESNVYSNTEYNVEVSTTNAETLDLGSMSRGNLITATAASGLTDITYHINGNGYTFIDSFCIYMVPSVEFYILDIPEGTTASTIAISDYLTVNYGELQINSSPDSLLFVAFDNFDIGDSRFVEFQGMNRGGDGTYGLRYKINGVPIPEAIIIQKNDMVVRRSFDLFTDNITSQMLYLRVENNVTLDISSIKFYTIDGWDFRSIDDMTDILDPNSYAYLGSTPTYDSIYDRFLQGEFGLLDLDTFNNPYNPNYQITELVNEYDIAYKHYDFNDDLDKVTSLAGNILTASGSELSVSNLSNEFSVHVQGAKTYGPYLMVVAKVDVGTARLSRLEAYFEDLEMISIFWESISETYVLGTNYSVLLIDMGKSPLANSLDWSNVTSFDIIFSTDPVVNVTGTVVIDSITLSPEASTALRYYGREIADEWLPGPGTIVDLYYDDVLRDYSLRSPRYVSRGTHNIISTFMEFPVHESIFTRSKYMEIIVRGTVDTIFHDFGYNVHGTYYSLGSIGRTYAYFRIDDLTTMPSFEMRSDSIIPEGQSFEIVAIRFPTNQYSWNASEIYDTWNTGPQTTLELLADRTRFRSLGLTEIGPVIQSALPAAIFTENNILKVDMSFSEGIWNGSIGYHLVVYDDMIDHVWSLDQGVINWGSISLYIDLQSHEFVNSPKIAIVSDDGSNVPIEEYVDVTSIKLFAGNTIEPYLNIRTISRQSSDYVINPDENVSNVATGYIMVDDATFYDSLYVDFEISDSSTIEFQIFVYDQFGRETLLQLDTNNATYYRDSYIGGERNAILLPLNDPAWYTAVKFIISIESFGGYMPSQLNFHTLTLINADDFNIMTGLYGSGFNDGEFIEGDERFASFVEAYDTDINRESTVLRTDGNSGSAGMTTWLPVGEYFMSFWYKAVSYQAGESIDILMNDSDGRSFSYTFDSDRWVHVRERVNIEGNISAYGVMDVQAILRVVDTDIAETVVFLSDLQFMRIPVDTIISDSYELGVETMALVDVVITPALAGIKFTMSGTASILDVVFDPETNKVDLYNDSIFQETILESWFANIRYRINLVSEADRILVSVWEASTLRQDRTIFSVIDVIPSMGSYIFTIESVDKSSSVNPVLHKVFMENSGANSGVNAEGLWELGAGVAYHKTATRNEKMTLINQYGVPILTSDYTLGFEIELVEGLFEMRAAGLNLTLGETQLSVNGVITAGFIEGSLVIEKNGYNLVVWLDGIAILSVAVLNESISDVVFFGAAEYYIEDIWLAHLDTRITDSAVLVLEGPEFLIKTGERYDLSRANYVTFSTRHGQIEVVTDVTHSENWLIEGTTTYTIEEILDVQAGTTREFHFLHKGVKVYFEGFDVFFKLHTVIMQSNIAGDGRLFQDEDMETTRYDGNNGIISPDSGLAFAYTSFGLDTGLIDVDFAFLASFEDAKFRLILRDDGIHSDYIQFRSRYVKSIESFCHYMDDTTGNMETITIRSGIYEREIIFSTPSGTDYYQDYEYFAFILDDTGEGSLLHPDLCPDATPDNVNTLDARGILDPGHHNIQAYILGNQYYVFLDGVFVKAFKWDTQMLNFTQSDIESKRVGVAVNNMAVAYKLNVFDGAMVDPEYTTSTNKFMLANNNMYLLSTDDTEVSSVQTRAAWNLYDLTSVRGYIESKNNATTRFSIVSLDGNVEVGAILENGLIQGYSIIDGTETTEMLYNNTRIENRRFIVEIDFEAGSAPNELVPKLYIWPETSFKNYTDYLELFSLSTDTNYRMRVSNDNGVSIVYSMSAITVSRILDQLGEDYIEVLEVSGMFPTYNLVGQSTYLAKLTGISGISNDVIVSGRTNSSIYAFDFMVNDRMNYLSSFDNRGINLDILRGSDVIISLRLKGDGIFLDNSVDVIRVATFDISRYNTVNLKLDMNTGNASVILYDHNGEMIDGSEELPVFNNFTHGEVLTVDLNSDLDPLVFTYVDNIKYHNDEIEYFVSGDATDSMYDRYNSFNLTLEKDKDRGARYLFANVMAMSEDVVLTAIINGLRVEEKVLSYSEFGSYNYYLFYIPHMIDTTRLTSISFDSTGLTRIESMGFLDDIIPESLLVTTASDPSALSQYDIVYDGGTYDYMGDIPGTDAARMVVESSSSFSPLAQGFHLDTSSSDLWDAFGIFNYPSGFEVNMRTSYTGYTTTDKQMFNDDEFIDIDRADLSVISIEHEAYKPFTTIIRANLEVGGVNGIGCYNVPFYLIVNIGPTSSVPRFSVGSSEMRLEKLVGHILEDEYYSIIDINKDTIYDNVNPNDDKYLWYTVDMEYGTEITTIDMEMMITQFEIAYWKEVKEKRDEGWDVRAYDTSGNFLSISGMYFSTNDPAGIDIKRINLIKNPVYDRFQPTLDRSSSYYSGLSNWEEVKTSYTGLVPLHYQLGLSETISQTALITSFANTIADTSVRIRFSSNLPAILYVNNLAISVISDVNNYTEIREVYVDTLLPGGINKITIMAYHPDGDRLSTDGSSVDGWFVGLSMIGEMGVDMNIESGGNQGLEGNYVSAWAVVKDLMEIGPVSTYIADSRVDDFGSFHNGIYIPGDRYNLKTNPDTSASVVKAGITEMRGNGSVTTPMISASTFTDYKIAEHEVPVIDGVFLASTTIHLTQDMLTPRMKFAFKFFDLNHIYAIKVNNFRIMYISPERAAYLGDEILTGWNVFNDALSTDVTSSFIGSGDLVYNSTTGYVNVTLALDAGFHRVSVGTWIDTTVNATEIYNGILDFGLELDTDDPLLKLRDNVYAIIKPNEFSTNNEKSVIKEYIGLIGDESNGPGTFTSSNTLDNSRGILQSSWYLSADGTVHMKRTMHAGFKSDAGSCATREPNDPIARTGTLYIEQIIDPGTPQMARTLVELYYNDYVIGQDPVLPESTYSFDGAVTTSFKSVFDNRDNYVSFNYIDVAIQQVNEGFRLSLPIDTVITAYDRKGVLIDISDGTVDSEGDIPTNIIGNIAIDGGISRLDTGSRILLASEYMTTLGSYDAFRISMDLGDTTLDLYPSYGILFLNGVDYDGKYNLISNVLYLRDGALLRSFSTSGMIEYIDTDSISGEFVDGAMNSEVEAFSKAKAQTARMVNTDQHTASSSTVFNSIEGTYENAYSKVVGTAVQKAKKITDFGLDFSSSGSLVESISEWYNGQLNTLTGNDISDWVNQDATEYFTFLEEPVAGDGVSSTGLFWCSVGHAMLEYADYQIQSFNDMMDDFRDVWDDHISKFFKKIGNAIGEIVHKIEEWGSDVDDAFDDWKSGYYLGDNVDRADMILDFEGWAMRPDIYEESNLALIARRIGLPDWLVTIFKVADMNMVAQNRMLFITLYSMIFGNAIGMSTMYRDLFPEASSGSLKEEYLNDSKLNNIMPTRYIHDNIIQIDKFLTYFGSSKTMQSIKTSTIEGLVKFMGWRLTYDPTPLGMQPSNETKSFANFEVIARPSENLLEWNYYFALEADFKLPLTIGTAIGLMTGGASAVLVVSTIQAISKMVVEWAFEDDSDGEYVGTLLSAIPSIGVLFAIGKENTGLIGFDELTNAVFGTDWDGDSRGTFWEFGPGQEGADDPYHRDEYGRQTEEKKWSFKLGLSEAAYMIFVEMGFAMISSILGPWVALYQDARDALFGDTFFDRAFAITQLPGDLVTINQVSKKASKTAITESLEEAQVQIMRNFVSPKHGVLGKFRNALLDMGETLGRFESGGASGLRGMLRKNLYPVIAFKRAILGRAGTKWTTGFIGKLAESQARQVTKEARLFMTKQLQSQMLRNAGRHADDMVEMAIRANPELSKVEADLLRKLNFDAYISDFAKKFDLDPKLVSKFDETYKRIFKDELRIRQQLADSTEEEIRAIGREVGNVDQIDRMLQEFDMLDAIKNIDEASAIAEKKAFEEVFGVFKAIPNEISAGAKLWRSVRTTIQMVLKFIFKPFMWTGKSIVKIGEILVKAFVKVMKFIVGTTDRGYDEAAELTDELYIAAKMSARADGLIDSFLLHSDEIFQTQQRRAAIIYERAKAEVRADPAGHGVPEICFMATTDDCSDIVKTAIEKSTQVIATRDFRQFYNGKMTLDSFADVYGSIWKAPRSGVRVDFDDVTTWTKKAHYEGTELLGALNLAGSKHEQDIVKILKDQNLLVMEGSSPKIRQINGDDIYFITRGKITPLQNAIATQRIRLLLMDDMGSGIKSAFKDLDMDSLKIVGLDIDKLIDDTIVQYTSNINDLRLLRSDVDMDGVRNMLSKGSMNEKLYKFAEYMAILDDLHLRWTELFGDIPIDYKYFKGEVAFKPKQGQDAVIALRDLNKRLFGFNFDEAKSSSQIEKLKLALGGNSMYDAGKFGKPSAAGAATITSDMIKAGSSTGLALKTVKTIDEANDAVRWLREDILNRIEYAKMDSRLWAKIANGEQFLKSSPFGIAKYMKNSVFDPKWTPIHWTEAKFIAAMQRIPQGVELPTTSKTLFNRLKVMGIVDSGMDELSFLDFIGKSAFIDEMGLDTSSLHTLHRQIQDIPWSRDMPKPYFLEDYDELMKHYPEYYPRLGGKLTGTMDDLMSVRHGSISFNGKSYDYTNLVLPVKDPDMYGPAYGPTRYIHLKIVSTTDDINKIIPGEAAYIINLRSGNKAPRELEAALKDALTEGKAGFTAPEFSIRTFDSATETTGLGEIVIKFDSSRNILQTFIPGLEQSNRLGTPVKGTFLVINTPRYGATESSAYRKYGFSRVVADNTRFIDFDIFPTFGKYSREASITSMAVAADSNLAVVSDLAFDLSRKSGTTRTRAVNYYFGKQNSNKYVDGLLELHFISEQMRVNNINMDMPSKYFKPTTSISDTAKGYVTGGDSFSLYSGGTFSTLDIKAIRRDIDGGIVTPNNEYYDTLKFILDNHDIYEKHALKINASPELFKRKIEDGVTILDIIEADMLDQSVTGGRFTDYTRYRMTAAHDLVKTNSRITESALRAEVKKLRAGNPILKADVIVIYTNLKRALDRLKDLSDDVVSYSSSTSVGLDSFDIMESRSFNYTDMNYARYLVDTISVVNSDYMDEHQQAYEMSRVVSESHNNRLIDQLSTFDSEVNIPISAYESRQIYAHEYSFDYGSGSYESTIYMNDYLNKIFINNGSGYYAQHDIMIDGIWNPSIFFSHVGLTSQEVEFLLDKGMVPMLQGNDLLAIQPIIRSAMIYYLRDVNDYHDMMYSDLMAYINPLMAPLDYGYIYARYYEIINDEVMSEFHLYDSSIDENVTLSDVYSSLMDAYISDAFSFIDRDGHLKASSTMINMMNWERVAEFSELRETSSIGGDTKRKVFGDMAEFVNIDFSDFHNISIHLLYSSMADNNLVRPSTIPAFIDDSEYGELTSDLQIYYGMDHISYVDGATTISSLREFMDEYMNAYNRKVVVSGATSWGDVGDLFSRAGGNPIDMFAMIQRDSDQVPNHIMNLFKKLISLNLYTDTGKMKYAIYINRIQFNN